LLESDQKILVSGTVTDAQNNTDFSIARYNTNGTTDTTFGTNGKTITRFVQGETSLEGPAIADSELIAVGSADDPLGSGILAEYNLGHLTAILDAADTTAALVTKNLIEPGSGLTITAAPNPTNSSFVIHMATSLELSSVTLQLVNNQGTVLQTIANVYPGQTMTIGGSLHPGMYFLTVMTGNSAQTIKLVKL